MPAARLAALQGVGPYARQADAQEDEAENGQSAQD